MVQESTMICVDNSEWMRNGDFVPTRLQCEQEAANLIMQCKLRANPENAVGLLSMANTVEVLSTMTQENGKLFMKLHQIEPKGESKFLTAIKVAHLALKHRQNRNHKMRIILFIGSPIDHVDTNELIKLAKKLKKEKVQVDVICFGEADAENSEIMGRFVETLNGRDSNNGGSNLVVVPSGSTLTEALLSSAICRGEDGTAAPVVTASGGGFEFGIDPEDDPDLALALRVSLEEQRQRLQQEAAAAAAAAANDGALDVTQPMDTTTTTTTQDVLTMDPATMSEEQQLEWALRMSMQDGGGAAAGGGGGSSVTTTTTTGATTTITTTTTTSASAKPSNITAANIATQQHSVQIDSSTLKQTDVKCKPDSEANNNNSSGSSSNNNKSQPQPQSQSQNMATTDDDQLGQLMSDPELLRQLVADLPGVDPNSQEIQDAVNSATEQAAQKESSQKEEREDNDDSNNNNDK